MKTSSLKNLAWTILGASAGGFALFLILVIDWGRLPPFPFFIWPAACAATGIVSVVILRNAFRREPFQWKGWWQLSVSDLIVISIIIGTFLTIFNATWPSTLLSVGIPIALGTTILLTWGMLIGARKGLRNTIYKAIYGIGWTTWIYGMFGTGAFVVLLIFASLFMGHDFVEVFQGLLYYPAGHEIWMTYIFRTGLACLPIGILCLKLSKRHVESSRTENGS